MGLGFAKARSDPLLNVQRLIMTTVQRPSTTARTGTTAASDAGLGAAALKTLASKIGAAAGDDKTFPDLTSGNRGVRGYELTGARAQLLLDLAGEGTKLQPGERVVGLLVTEDESWVKLAIVNDSTLAARDGGEINFNNVPMTTKGGDEIDPFHGYYLLLKGAPELPLAHGDSDSSWSIDAYKSDDGPARLPKLELPKPVKPTPPPPDFVDAAGADYLAGKIAEHAGGKLPALDGGTRGAHAYEVSPADAGAIAKALGSSFSAADAKHQVFVAILETGEKPQLRGLLLSRADIGKAKISSASIDAKGLDGNQIATLLKNAKELPVVGRVTGFSVSELGAARPTQSVSQVIGSEKPALPSTSTSTDRSNSPLATRLQAATQVSAKPTKRDGEDAARAYTNLLTGWGNASDAEKLGKFLAGADADVFAAFAAKLGGSKPAWHPGHIKAAFAEKAALQKFAAPIAATLAALPAAPAGLDPAATGTDLKNFATGWYTASEISRLVVALPAVLDDAFAFAAAVPNARHTVDVDKGAVAARAAAKKVATRELASRTDPTEKQLLQELINAL